MLLTYSVRHFSTRILTQDHFCILFFRIWLRIILPWTYALLLTTTKTPPPVSLSGLSHLWISYSQAKMPCLTHLSIRFVGLQPRLRHYHYIWISTVNQILESCLFVQNWLCITFETFPCVGAFLFFHLLCFVDEDSGHNVVLASNITEDGCRYNGLYNLLKLAAPYGLR